MLWSSSSLNMLSVSFPQSCWFDHCQAKNIEMKICFVFFFRLGTLLSGHVVNDSHLRKQEQAHKDLIIACKVCMGR